MSVLASVAIQAQPQCAIYHESGEMDLEDLILSGLPQISALLSQPLGTRRFSANGMLFVWNSILRLEARIFTCSMFLEDGICWLARLHRISFGSLPRVLQMRERDNHRATSALQALSDAAPRFVFVQACHSSYVVEVRGLGKRTSFGAKSA